MREIKAPRLMLITDRQGTRLPLADLAKAAVDGGVDAIQVREKDLAGDDLIELVSSIQRAVAGRAHVLVNGDLDVARSLGVGLHLPERAMPTAKARSQLPPGSLVGRSVHDHRSAARESAADYLIGGHVYPTPSKSGLAALGVGGLAEIVAAATCPVLAVGGINEHVVGDVVSHGAHGVAVISAIGRSPDPRQAARRLRDEIDRFQERTMAHSNASPMVELTINGKPVVLPSGTTISAFIATKGFTERMVVVELNGTVLARSAFSSTVLQSGDNVEMVHAVGGG